jgi:hypothetical protein
MPDWHPEAITPQDLDRIFAIEHSAFKTAIALYRKSDF